MSTLSEPRHNAAFLISQANGYRSVDAVTVTVPASTTLRAGRVMGQNTSSGKFVEYDNGSSDGREEAAGVLLNELVNDTVGAVDVTASMVVRDAEVRTSDLSWKSDQEANDQTAGLADLLAIGIVARS